MKNGSPKIVISYPRGNYFLYCLLWNLPDFGWTKNLNALQEPIVLVVVRHDYVTFLLLCQHELHVVLNIGSRLFKCRINILGSKVDDVETVLQVAHHMGDFFV